jgi:hypothetical protein
MAAVGSDLLESWNKEHESIDEVTQSLVVMNNQTLASLDGMEQLRDKIADISKDIADSLRRGAIDALDELAEAIGTGNWDTASFVRALISPLADMAISAGVLIMTTGESIEALKEALTNIFSGPYAAIAAGAALVAIGVAAKAGLAAIASGSTTSGGSAGGGNPYTYTGGYGVTPDMLSSAGPMEIEGTVTVKGQDIQIALDNYNANKRR